MQEKIYYSVEDIARMLGVSEGKGYMFLGKWDWQAKVFWLAQGRCRWNISRVNGMKSWGFKIKKEEKEGDASNNDSRGGETRFYGKRRFFL